jgi:hypothetical protein
MSETKHMTAAEWRAHLEEHGATGDDAFLILSALETQSKAHEQIIASWKREEHGWDEERARLLVEAKAHAEQLSILKLREVALIGDWELLHPFTKHGEVKSAFMDRLERFAESMENLKQDSSAPALAEMRERLAMEVCAIRLGITKGENEIIAGVWKRQPEEHRKQYLVEVDRLLSAIGGTAT